MKLLFLSAACMLCLAAGAQNVLVSTTQNGLVGRWDINVRQGNQVSPSWLEVDLSGIKTLVGRFVGSGGSARPITEVLGDSSAFSFSIPPQWERSDRPLTLHGRMAGDSIVGTIETSSGSVFPFTGTRAPYLSEKKSVTWGRPVILFNGTDLTGWKATGSVNQWYARDGVLTSPHTGSNLVTTRAFRDFKLHVEFKYGKGSNSGVYLRGRYEVQIEDSPPTVHPDSHLLGGVYGFLVPCEMAVKGPDEWQTYDITLVGRMVTVVLNGKTIICHQEIPGITGGALDSNEGAPGPIYFQGDHGPIEFRNIIITPAE